MSIKGPPASHAAACVRGAFACARLVLGERDVVLARGVGVLLLDGLAAARKAARAADAALAHDIIVVLRLQHVGRQLQHVVGHHVVHDQPHLHLVHGLVAADLAADRLLLRAPLRLGLRPLRLLGKETSRIHSGAPRVRKRIGESAAWRTRARRRTYLGPT